MGEFFELKVDDQDVNRGQELHAMWATYFLLCITHTGIPDYKI